MSGLLVEQSLGLAQLQDAGRFGVRHLGVTQGGALDWVAMYWANWLLGNALTCSVIEIPLGGLVLLCEQDSTLALAGADLGATLDEQPLQTWNSFAARKGQRLVFDTPRVGVRAYLAAPGGFDGPATLGSQSTVVREALGGLDGQGSTLRRGDKMLFTDTDVLRREIPHTSLPDYSSPARLSVIPGAQYSAFTALSLYQAFNHAWRIDQRADRMGIRLVGPELRYTGAPMISEGIPGGAIQVPPDGQPIVLLNDRQTIGGYPRLGALTPSAMSRLAQLATGETARLVATDPEAARREHLELLHGWHSPR